MKEKLTCLAFALLLCIFMYLNSTNTSKYLNTISNSFYMSCLNIENLLSQNDLNNTSSSILSNELDNLNSIAIAFNNKNLTYMVNHIDTKFKNANASELKIMKDKFSEINTYLKGKYSSPSSFRSWLVKELNKNESHLNELLSDLK